jgi:hypothetical protein
MAGFNLKVAMTYGRLIIAIIVDICFHRKGALRQGQGTVRK